MMFGPWRDHRGVAALEFAIAAPLLLIVLIGGLELGYANYIRTVLEGEMQQASRSRALEDASVETQRTRIERRVRDMVHKLAPKATVTFTRRAFRDYAGLNAAYEPFNDANFNGKCDASETFDDLNDNGIWDQTTGQDSDGNANDVVVYTATVHNGRLIPVLQNPFQGSDDIVVRTTLRNQPFTERDSPLQRSCD